MNTKAIANTIFQQLGGSQFSFMTGAKNFVYGLDDKGNAYLMFAIPLNCFNTKFSKVKITLNAMDTYDIEFYKNKVVNGFIEPISMKTINGIYYDQLQDIFEVETNLLVTINPRPIVKLSFKAITIILRKVAYENRTNN